MIYLISKEHISLDHIKPHNTLHSTTENVLSSAISPNYYEGELENNIINNSLYNENEIK